MWSYEESLAWLYGRQRLGIKLGLAKVERLLHALGDPHRSFRSVHVAGTNGKGSVARMVAEALRRSGRRIGCTTSPHLVSFTERIEVDGRPIAKQAVAAGLQRIRSAVEALDAAGQQPTFFEAVTALAFLHFAEAGVEWAVVEVGLGGRLDATNVLEPDLCIVTNVGLDHQRLLGATVTQIALEKAGILKPGVPCVTACRGEALQVLKAVSHERRVPMSVVGASSLGSATAAAADGDYTVVPDPRHLVLLRPNGESRYEVGLAGAHQRQNAAVVVAAVEALRSRGVDVPESALRGALRETRNPGRLHTFRPAADELAPGAGPHPVEVLVDGAHNVDGAAALRRHLADVRWSGFDLVAGFCSDKPWPELLDAWLPLAARLWAVPVRNPRSLEPQRIVEQAPALPAAALPDIRSALAAAAGAGAQRVLVAGSLFLAGEAVAVLEGRSLEEIHGAQ